MDLLTTTYKDKIEGTLSCLDRVIITGTIPQICYSQGMTSYLYSPGIRICDYAKFAEPFRDELRANAEQIATGTTKALICFMKSSGGILSSFE